MYFQKYCKYEKKIEPISLLRAKSLINKNLQELTFFYKIKKNLMTLFSVNFCKKGLILVPVKRILMIKIEIKKNNRLNKNLPSLPLTHTPLGEHGDDEQ